MCVSVISSTCIQIAGSSLSGGRGVCVQSDDTLSLSSAIPTSLLLSLSSSSKSLDVECFTKVYYFWPKECQWLHYPAWLWRNAVGKDPCCDHRYKTYTLAQSAKRKHVQHSKKKFNTADTFLKVILQCTLLSDENRVLLVPALWYELSQKVFNWKTV